jgi:hypothetical protein
MSKSETIFVYLEDEGTDVWRPTQAERLADGSYRLLAPPDYDPQDEKWEFPPGTVVRCQRRKLAGGEKLVAVRTAADARKNARKRTA